MIFNVNQTERDALVLALQDAITIADASDDLLIAYAKLIGPHYMTAIESEAFLGSNWGICRATPTNRAQYGRCISQADYAKAERAALLKRGHALRDKAISEARARQMLHVLNVA